MTAKRAKNAKNTQSSWLNKADSLLKLPRIIRILFVGFISLMFALLIFPIADTIYFNYFFSPDTRMASAYVIAGIGLISYLVGWRIMVGGAGEELRASKLILGYLVFAGGTSLLVFTLIAYGFVIRNTSL